MESSRVMARGWTLEVYDRLGVDELLVFDPHASATSRRRIRFQLFRRVGKRGLVRAFASQGDRVCSKTLGVFVRAIGRDDGLRLRLGLGKTGDTLYATEAEAERAAKKVERAAKEVERAAKEVERAAKRSNVRPKRSNVRHDWKPNKR